MLSKDLKITELCITEDFYDYKGTFKVCTEDKYISIDMLDFNDKKISEIGQLFDLEDHPNEIRNTIMSKLLEAAKTESRNVQGTV